jgi:hypothetical protein
MIIQKILPFNNVAANSTASVELSKGMTYNRIILKLGGTTFTKALIDNIKCKLNGKTFFECSGSALDLINKYRGLAADDDYLTIDFLEPFAKTLGGMYAGAIGTAKGVNSFTIEVEIGAATAPTLEAWAQVSAPMELGPIAALVNHPVSLSAGGKFPIVLPHGPEAGLLLERVHFFHSHMTTLEVKKNGLVIWEDIDATTLAYMTEEFGQAAQSGLYVYDPVMNRDLKGVVNTANAQDLRFNVTVSEADTINCYAEYFGPLANL